MTKRTLNDSFDCQDQLQPDLGDENRWNQHVNETHQINHGQVYTFCIWGVSQFLDCIRWEARGIFPGNLSAIAMAASGGKAKSTCFSWHLDMSLQRCADATASQGMTVNFSRFGLLLGWSQHETKWNGRGGCAWAIRDPLNCWWIVGSATFRCAVILFWFNIPGSRPWTSRSMRCRETIQMQGISDPERGRPSGQKRHHMADHGRVGSRGSALLSFSLLMQPLLYSVQYPGN